MSSRADSFRDAARAAARAERLGADVVARARLARSRDRRDEQLLRAERDSAAAARTRMVRARRRKRSGAPRHRAGPSTATARVARRTSPRRLQDDDEERPAPPLPPPGRACPRRRDAARLQLVAIRAARRRSAGGRRVRETWRRATRMVAPTALRPTTLITCATSRGAAEPAGSSRRRRPHASPRCSPKSTRTPCSRWRSGRSASRSVLRARAVGLRSSDHSARDRELLTRSDCLDAQVVTALALARRRRDGDCCAQRA